MRFPKSGLTVPRLLPVAELSSAVAERVTQNIPITEAALWLGQKKRLGFSEILQNVGHDY